MSYWKLKKSRVPGKIPTLNEIDYDTIVLNQVDGIAYVRKKGLDGDPDEVIAIAGGSDLPADLWRSSVAGQISGLAAKTDPVGSDMFVIDDSETEGAKKKTTLSNIYNIFKNAFDLIYSSLTKALGSDINTGTDDSKYVTSKAIADSNVFRAEKAGQILGLPSQTLADSAMFMWESQVDGWVKVRSAFGTIKSTLKAYFDGLYTPLIYKAIGTDINTGTNDTQYVTPKAIADSDLAFLSDIEWQADTNGVKLKTNADNVGIGGLSDTVAKLKLVKETSDTDKAATVLIIERTTTGTAGDGLAATVVFRTEIPSGSVVDGAFIQSKLANGGTDLLLEFGTVTVRMFLDGDGNLQLVNGATLIISSADFVQWGVTTEGAWRKGRSGNNLVEQRYESGVWVNKQITSA